MNGRSARQSLRGLYIITDNTSAGAQRLGARVEAALRGGAGVVQYRDKGSDVPRRLAEAEALRALTQAYGVPLVINDDLELALAVGPERLSFVRRGRRRLGVFAEDASRRDLRRA